MTTGTESPKWTLSPTQQLQTDTLLNNIARMPTTDSLRLPEISPYSEILVLELHRISGTKKIANIIMDSFVTHWSLYSPMLIASTLSELFFRLRINMADTLSRPSADIDSTVSQSSGSPKTMIS